MNNIKDSFYTLAGSTKTICICKSVSSGMIISQATGFKVLVAFKDSNIAYCVREALTDHQDAIIILCADNDNIKINKEISEKYKILCVWPDGIKGNNFEDMSDELGITTVTETIIKGRVSEIYKKKTSKNNKINELVDNSPEVLKNIIKYYNTTAIKPQPLFALATGLIFGSVILGRQYLTQFNNYTSNYFLLVAKSGTGKDHPKFIIRKLLESCNLGWLERSGGYTAGNTVVRSLEAQPLQVSFFEEIGQSLAEASNKNKSLSSSMFRQLLDIWSSCHSSSVGVEYINGNTPRAARPALSIVGITTPRELYRSITESLIEQGFINRLLPFISEQEREATKLQETNNAESKINIVKTWVLKHWPKNSSEIGMLVEPEDSERANPNNGETTRVDFEPEAVDFLDKIEVEIIQSSNELEKIHLEDMPSRQREITMRIALVIAVMDNHTSISLKHTKWAWSLVGELYRRYIDNVKQHVAGSEFEEAKLEGLNDLRKRGKDGIKPSDMPKKRPWSKFDKKLRTEVLNELQESGLAEQIKKKTGRRGPGTTVWVALN